MIVCEVPGLNASHAPIVDCMLLCVLDIIGSCLQVSQQLMPGGGFHDLLLATFDWHVFSSS